MSKGKGLTPAETNRINLMFVCIVVIIALFLLAIRNNVNETTPVDDERTTVYLIAENNLITAEYATCDAHNKNNKIYPILNTVKEKQDGRVEVLCAISNSVRALGLDEDKIVNGYPISIPSFDSKWVSCNEEDFTFLNKTIKNTDATLMLPSNRGYMCKENFLQMTPAYSPPN